MPAVTPDIAQTEAAIVKMTNEFRASQKLGAVVPDPVLQAAARAFARYLAKSGDFSHTADGKTPSQRADAAGYKGCRLAENLAMQMDSLGFDPETLATRAVEGWIKSPGHRANLLTPGATDVAVAIERVPDEHPKYVSVQLLGRPQKYAIRFSIANRTQQVAQYTFGKSQETIRPKTRVIHTTCDTGTIKFETTASEGGAIELTPSSGATYIIKNSPGRRGIAVETEVSAALPAQRQP